jgi:2-iminobutanoate/2-iminopropanoate deaminase
MKSKSIIHSAGAPGAVGPYSQATSFGELLFTAGQIPLDPVSGQLVGGGIEDQTRRVLLNLEAVLEAGGSDLSRVLKTTVFLTDLGDFTAMNSVYAEFFKESPPARSTVQVSALPKAAIVEIEAIAFRSHL